MRLNKRQIASVLAALRHWQRHLSIHGSAVSTRGSAYCEHFMHESPLSIKEIDDLCERLNTKSRSNP